MGSIITQKHNTFICIYIYIYIYIYICIVLKNNYFQFLDKTFKHKWGTAIRTKFAPPYFIFFIADLEQRLLSDKDLKPYIWWRYIDDIFLIWEYVEESLRLFLEKINSISQQFSSQQIGVIARLIF